MKALKKSNVSAGYHCWITNVSKKIIVLGDLGLRISPWRTVDLLDPRYSKLTVEQVQKSMKDGSLYKRKKQKVIITRESAPEPPQERQIDVAKASFPYKLRSLVDATSKTFEELELEYDDEDFANKNADNSFEERNALVGDISKYNKNE